MDGPAPSPLFPRVHIVLCGSSELAKCHFRRSCRQRVSFPFDAYMRICKYAPGRPCSARCSSSGALEAVRPARVGLQHMCDLVVPRSCTISMRGQESLNVGTHRRLFVARRARRATRFRLFVWVVDQLAEEEEHRPSLRRMSNACGSAAVRLFERSSRWRTLPPLDHRKAGASTGPSTRSGSECSM